MLSDKELAMQKKSIAKMRQNDCARKSKNVVKAGQVPSQWGKVVTNEQRLIDNGHYMKSNERASLDSAREGLKDAKIAQKLGMGFDEYRLAKRMGTLPKTIIPVKTKLRKKS